MRIQKALAKLITLGLIAYAMSPLAAQAGEVSNRSLTLGSSAAGAITTHEFDFTIFTGGNVGSIKFEYCTTAYGACSTPADLDTTAATLDAQSGTGATGFTIDNDDNGAPFLTRASANINAAAAVSYTLGNIENPSGVNAEYWVRITTYVSTDTTGGFTDNGVVTLNTAQQITVTGVMPESLVFCVGTSGTNCGNITGSAVNLGTFSPTATNTGTSVMSASTNAGFGYVITVNGTTLSSGANNIPAMGTQSLNSTGCTPSCSSAIGSSQFGTNVRDNATPNVGADVTGAGSATGFGGYNTADSFRFFSGDTVASEANTSQANLFTNSYIVNVGGDQAAGQYTATFTYIATATF